MRSVNGAKVVKCAAFKRCLFTVHSDEIQSHIGQSASRLQIGRR